MSTVGRFEFMGNTFLFWVLILTGILSPLGVIYLLKTTVWIEEDVEDVNGLLSRLKRERL